LKKQVDSRSWEDEKRVKVAKGKWGGGSKNEKKYGVCGVD